MDATQGRYIGKRLDLVQPGTSREMHLVALELKPKGLVNSEQAKRERKTVKHGYMGGCAKALWLSSISLFYAYLLVLEIQSGQSPWKIDVAGTGREVGAEAQEVHQVCDNGKNWSLS